MRFIIVTVLLCLTLLLAADGQQENQPGKTGEAEKIARDMFSNGEYGEAVRYLERANQDRPDEPPLLSLLGMAYLYSSSRIDSAANFAKARPVMEKAIEHDGEAAFFVGLATDKLKEKFVIKATMGELRIRRDSLTFTPSRASSEGVGPFSKGDVKDCGLNRGYGKDSGTFHIKTGRGDFNFRPLHFSREEANLACELVGKYLGARLTN